MEKENERKKGNFKKIRFKKMCFLACFLVLFNLCFTTCFCANFSSFQLTFKNNSQIVSNKDIIYHNTLSVPLHLEGIDNYISEPILDFNLYGNKTLIADLSGFEYSPNSIQLRVMREPNGSYYDENYGGIRSLYKYYYMIRLCLRDTNYYNDYTWFTINQIYRQDELQAGSISFINQDLHATILFGEKLVSMDNVDTLRYKNLILSMFNKVEISSGEDVFANIDIYKLLLYVFELPFILFFDLFDFNILGFGVKTFVKSLFLGLIILYVIMRIIKLIKQ